jgi:hypothetical protein
MRIFIYTIIVVVAAATIWGFVVVGSPTEERARRFDEQRVTDLQSIQNNLIYYWQAKNKLPDTLAALQDATRGVTIPKDPEKNSDYGYSIKPPLSFSLCTDFNRADDGSMAYPQTIPEPIGSVKGQGLDTNWQHAAGHVCFERTIDPDFYKPLNNR